MLKRFYFGLLLLFAFFLVVTFPSHAAEACKTHTDCPTGKYCISYGKGTVGGSSCVGVGIGGTGASCEDYTSRNLPIGGVCASGKCNSTTLKCEAATQPSCDSFGMNDPDDPKITYSGLCVNSGTCYGGNVAGFSCPQSGQVCCKMKHVAGTVSCDSFGKNDPNDPKVTYSGTCKPTTECTGGNIVVGFSCPQDGHSCCQVKHVGSGPQTCSINNCKACDASTNQCIATGCTDLGSTCTQPALGPETDGNTGSTGGSQAPIPTATPIPTPAQSQFTYNRYCYQGIKYLEVTFNAANGATRYDVSLGGHFFAVSEPNARTVDGPITSPPYQDEKEYDLTVTAINAGGSNPNSVKFDTGPNCTVYTSPTPTPTLKPGAPTYTPTPSLLPGQPTPTPTLVTQQPVDGCPDNFGPNQYATCSSTCAEPAKVYLNGNLACRGSFGDPSLVCCVRDGSNPNTASFPKSCTTNIQCTGVGGYCNQSTKTCSTPCPNNGYNRCGTTPLPGETVYGSQTHNDCRTSNAPGGPICFRKNTSTGGGDTSPITPTKTPTPSLSQSSGGSGGPVGNQQICNIALGEIGACLSSSDKCKIDRCGTTYRCLKINQTWCATTGGLMNTQDVCMPCEGTATPIPQGTGQNCASTGTCPSGLACGYTYSLSTKACCPAGTQFCDRIKADGTKVNSCMTGSACNAAAGGGTCEKKDAHCHGNDSACCSGNCQGTGATARCI